jgi:purine-nucleoside/S-methyl-5'-thioadenosine phosphorylase / adenosine deaminase
VDDRHRGGGPRLRECGGARTDRLSDSLIPAHALDATGLVRAAFTTRLGGVSIGPYHSLNLSRSVGDDPEAVSTNRGRLGALLEMAPRALVEAEQVHGNRAAVVASGGPPIPGMDALVTNRAGLWLAIYAADCVPVLLVDAETPGVAAVHAGWRGTAAGIVPETIARMRTAFGTDPERCTATLGPAIGGCCYEVDLPVARAMEQAPWWPEAARATGPERWHLDLRTAIRRQLIDAGVPAVRIASVPLCTSCRPDLFYSYRRDGVTGRMAACISLLG